MSEPSIKQIVDKLGELIKKHNDLAQAVQNLCESVEIINETLLGKDTHKTLDS